MRNEIKKAIVKATGQLIEVMDSFNIETSRWGYMNAKTCRYYDSDQLEFNFPLKNPDKEDTIDWEQRRYEITKTVVGNMNISDYEDDEEVVAKCIIDLADALIKELKKRNNEI